MRELCQWMARRIIERVEYPTSELEPERFQDEEAFDVINIHIRYKEEVRHILWMLEEIPKLYSQAYQNHEGFWYGLDSRDKAQRWLGFVQGWGWTGDYWTVNELREKVREFNV
jgi:hypothetical protein